jgi:hypothetical protein
MPDRRRLKRVAARGFAPRSSRLMGVIALAATLVVVFAATGCGGSKKSASTASTPALTKAQFLAQGNAICTEGNQKLAALQKALEKTFGNRAPNASQIAGYVNTTFAPIIQSQIDRLKALGAPSGERAKVTSLLALAQADLSKVKSNPQALISQRHPFADFAQQAHAYGLTACAQGA